MKTAEDAVDAEERKRKRGGRGRPPHTRAIEWRKNQDPSTRVSRAGAKRAGVLPRSGWQLPL